LFGNGVLICEDGARSKGCGGVDGINGGDYGEEVLEFVEVIGGCFDGAVEGVV